MTEPYQSECPHCHEVLQPLSNGIPHYCRERAPAAETIREIEPPRDPLREILELILGDAERCVERGDLQGADEALQVAFEAERPDATPLLHVLCAHITSLDARRRKLVAWVQLAKEKLPQPILEPRGESQ